jgi:nicotinamide phosphoribosyltransferase
MTSLGEAGEPLIVQRLLDNHPAGILSVVADSYNYYHFVQNLVGGTFKADILARDGVFVVRPDSVTRDHPNPEELVLWTLETLWESFGGTETEQGYKVLDPHVRVLWGDGIDPTGIHRILHMAEVKGFAASNLVFGMGGGLLQKVNRDTQRFAFKSSAQFRGGAWRDVFKKPLDISKTSKAGRLSLVPHDGGMTTVSWPNDTKDLLQVVFEDGRVVNPTTFAEVRERAAGLVHVTQ